MGYYSHQSQNVKKLISPSNKHFLPIFLHANPCISQCYLQTDKTHLFPNQIRKTMYPLSLQISVLCELLHHTQEATIRFYCFAMDRSFLMTVSWREKRLCANFERIGSSRAINFTYYLASRLSPPRVHTWFYWCRQLEEGAPGPTRQTPPTNGCDFAGKVLIR